MNAGTHFYVCQDKSNKIRQCLISYAESDLKKSKKCQQKILVNSKSPKFESDSFVVHLNGESFTAGSRFTPTDIVISKRLVRKESDVFDYRKIKKDENMKNDEFYSDYHKFHVNNKIGLAEKKNKNFNKKISKEMTSSDKKLTNQIVNENLENINLTKAFLTDVKVYKRVKRSFYYIRDICDQLKKLTKNFKFATSPLIQSNRKNTQTSKSSDNFSQFEQMIMSKENIDDTKASLMKKQRESNLQSVFKRFKSSDNILDVLISPKKSGRKHTNNTDFGTVNKLGQIKLNNALNISPTRKRRTFDDTNCNSNVRILLK